MLEKVYLSGKTEKMKNSDLYLHQCGKEACAPLHEWGSGIRDCYLIHYVLEGRGIFRAGGRQWTLRQGDGFLIYPNEVSYYQAGRENPWRYCWVGFHGIKAPSCMKQAGFSMETPVFHYPVKDTRLADCVFDLIEATGPARGNDLKVTSLLFQFMYLLVSNASASLPETETEKIHEKYIRNAIEYMQMNYPRKISITQIAEYIGLDRSYFYTIFKKYTELSPQQFLLLARMEKACRLLVDSALPIGHIACSVGYNDPLLFSKMFRRCRDMSPSEYRRCHATENRDPVRCVPAPPAR